MDLEKIKLKLREFAEERDWEQFHDPKNLSMALSVEVAELVEIFQWSKSGGLDEIKDQNIKKEIDRDKETDKDKYEDDIKIGDIVDLPDGTQGEVVGLTPDGDLIVIRDDGTKVIIPKRHVKKNDKIWI